MKLLDRKQTKSRGAMAVGMGFAGLVISITMSLPTKSWAFEPGQRWSCITDQGEQAFLAVLDVQGEAVSFSWGVMNQADDTLSSLCNKRDELSIQEMGEFCKLLGNDFSAGHVKLSESCQAKGH